MTSVAPRVRLAVRDVGTYGGIGRYVAELVAGLQQVADLEAHVNVIGPTISPWAHDAEHTSVPNIPLGGSLALLGMPRDKDTVTHFPLHETTPVFAACRGPLVMTIHSVEPLYMRASELYESPPTRFHKLPLQLLRTVRWRLARVVTPSAFERDRIIEHLRIPSDRIDVIPHGIRHDIFLPGNAAASTELVQRRWELTEPYVLYVGHHQPQKNVAALIRAFALLGRSDVTLAIAGNIERCREQYATVGAAANVKFLGEVNDDRELAHLYRAAQVFCFPSLHESFGLPALEAMACGCAVAAARGSGLEETVGNAALLFDPRSIEEIAERLETLLDDDVVRQRLMRAGAERAQSFTWGSSISAHIETYRQAAG